MNKSFRSDQAVVSVRLVTADYHLTSPINGLDIGYSTYRGLEVKKVPVIRVFGSTSTGHKVCLHVHGVLPYLYIPYDGSSAPDRMARQIVVGLDKALNILQGQGTSTVHHVFKAVLVRGIPMYGFHRKEHQLFKVYFYNPTTRKHSYDLLMNGAVLNKVLEPCEAHIPYILQFMMDFNLQGMNYIHLKNAQVRRAPSNGFEALSPSRAEPVTTCEIELDCTSADILNSLDVQEGVRMNPGLAALWEEEIERRNIKKMNCDSIHPPPSQPRTEVRPTSSHMYYKDQLEERLIQYLSEMGDVSLSFSEINEQLETSLAIEIPEDIDDRDILSASSLDLHSDRQPISDPAPPSDAELLDLLVELAEEHEETISGSQNTSSSTTRWTVTSPLLDFQSTGDMIEDLPLDDDSIIGSCSQRVRSSENHPEEGEDDEDDKETLEMTQIFQPDDPESSKNGDDSSCDMFLPNLDGANDSSSSEEQPKGANKRKLSNKTIKKYKPLTFRPSSSNSPVASSSSMIKEQSKMTTSTPSPSILLGGPSSINSPMASSMVKEPSEIITSTPSASPMVRGITKLISSTPSASPMVKEPTKVIKEYKEYENDALYSMGFPSPIQDTVRESPPRPDTPIKDLKVTIERFIDHKLKPNSCKVVLKSLEEEVRSYQKGRRRKLKISDGVLMKSGPLIGDSSTPLPTGSSSQYKLKTSNESHPKPITLIEDSSSPLLTGSSDPSSRSSSQRKTRISDESLPQPIIDIRYSSSPIPTGSSNVSSRSSSQSKLKISDENLPKPIVQIEDSNSPLLTGSSDLSFRSSSQRKLKISDEILPQPIIQIEDSNSPLPTGSSNLSFQSSSQHKLKISDEILPQPVVQVEDSNSPLPSGSSFLSSRSPILRKSKLFDENLPPKKKLKENSSPPIILIEDSEESCPIEVSKISHSSGSILSDGEENSCMDSTIIQSQIQPSLPSIFLPGCVYKPLDDPPTIQHVIESMDQYGILSTDNGAPFWGDPKDSSKPKELRGKTLIIGNQLVRSLPEFGSTKFSMVSAGSKPIILTLLNDPPSRQSVMKWLEEEEEKKTKNKKDRINNQCDRSQLEAVSMNNSFGFRASFGNCVEAKAVHQYQYLTILSVEIHASSRGNLNPDPEFDAIQAVFYSISHDAPPESSLKSKFNGIIYVKNIINLKGAYLDEVETVPVENEVELFEKLVQLIMKWNPDIFVGYEIEMLSWGYIFQRGVKLGIPIQEKVSRIPGTGQPADRVAHLPEDIIEGGYMVEKNSDISVVGRIVLNLWRLLRSEIAVQSYTFENMVFHLLHRRIPIFPFEKLTKWWNSSFDRWQVMEHYVTRVRGNLELMDQLDLIGRTSELARLFGIQFYEVFTRGSQFRVESMMLRLAKPKNFVAASPTVMQRAKMKAPEWLPLILEPESKFYTDPILVLDFQSLYPSMIIAYNYCFSTCLGRTHLLAKNEPFNFGCSQLRIPPEILKHLIANDLINFSPAGVAFVKPSVRLGIIPQMLDEILNTRIMVKQSMKDYPDDPALRRIFESRQLGLKLIANVTYGYTSANFSGRMPCVELADSVVSKGRETLERTIQMIESHPKWRAKVVYGDTDSVFVLLSGRNRMEAFAIGKEMADEVTKTNPAPVKLKFEKVYHPCILQTKKRYVGYKYESKDQVDPVYEAKGIETVRRDGCPAVVKILERSLRVLFESKDVSRVKSYVQRQFSKIQSNRANIQEFIFAKEFRGRQGYKPGACVPALEIAKNQLKTDPRSEARIGQRVPYVVVYGSPGVPLIKLVVPAEKLLQDPSLRLNAEYYITRAIVPALQRCFGLLGVDVLSWYSSLPRVVVQNPGIIQQDNRHKATISQYFASSACLLCEEPMVDGQLCVECRKNKQGSCYVICSRQRLLEKDLGELLSLCKSCTGSSATAPECNSMDCPVLYRRLRAGHRFQMVSKLQEALLSLVN